MQTVEVYYTGQQPVTARVSSSPCRRAKYITAVSYSQNLNLTMHEGGRSILLLHSNQLLLESLPHHVYKEQVYYIAVTYC